MVQNRVNFNEASHRQVGSQSEVPNFIFHGINDIEVTGYQGYTIKNKSFRATKKQTELK